MDRFDAEHLRGLAARVRARLDGEPDSGAARTVRRTVDYAETTLTGLLRHRAQHRAAGQRLLDTLGAPVWDSLVRVALSWRDDPAWPVVWASFSYELSGARTMKETMVARERLYLGKLADTHSFAAAALGEPATQGEGA
jgi:hypothetical protein